MKDYRSLFPVTRRLKYLNNAGVAPPPTTVRAAIDASLIDIEENGLTEDDRWERQADDVRGAAARLIGAGLDEVAFVRNTSHGLGLVAEGLDWKPGDEVAVATSIEYPSNVYPWQCLAGRGVKLREIAVHDGGVTPEAVAAALTPQTRLVTVSAVQYISGHRTDLSAIGSLCRERNVLFCVDGIQQVGAFPLDVKACGIHFLAADSHKWMMGLPGIGILYVDEAVVTRVRPVLVGWKTSTSAFDFDRAQLSLPGNARRFEEGSPAYAMIAGLGASLALIHEAGIASISAHIRALTDRLEAGARAAGAMVGPTPAARAGIVSIATRGDAAACVEACKARGIMVSLRRGRLRAAPHLFNNDDDIDALIDVLTAHA